MSDGPFKNLKLVKGWRKFTEAAYNDAFDRVECCAMASDAVVCDVLTPPVQSLLSVLKAYVDRNQLDFDPLSSINKIFSEHSRVSFADTLQKNMSYQLSDNVAPSVALEQGLASSVNDQINISRTRIHEECIRSCEVGEMRQDQLDRTIKRTNSVFESLNRNTIYDAVLACDKRAFKNAVAKKDGLDEGPSL
jgi:hypothetical protein